MSGSGVHEVGNCINIVTYCVIISVGLLSAGRANLSVEMHFKVLLCNDQEKHFASTVFVIGVTSVG